MSLCISRVFFIEFQETCSTYPSPPQQRFWRRLRWNRFPLKNLLVALFPLCCYLPLKTKEKPFMTSSEIYKKRLAYYLFFYIITFTSKNSVFCSTFHGTISTCDLIFSDVTGFLSKGVLFFRITVLLFVTFLFVFTIFCRKLTCIRVIPQIPLHHRIMKKTVDCLV